MESLELRQGSYLPMNKYIRALLIYFNKNSPGQHYRGNFSNSLHSYQSIYRKTKFWFDKDMANCDVRFNGPSDFNLIIKAEIPKKDLESLVEYLHNANKEELEHIKLHDSF
ncbi:MAG: hypothetical protein KKE23_01440 [Nanoarchaeota archaeon]|nr:hypothetical protein [Nanoarchaeota archaeon]